MSKGKKKISKQNSHSK